MRWLRCSSWRWAGEPDNPRAPRGGDRSAWHLQPLRYPERARTTGPGPVPRRNSRRGRWFGQWQVGTAAQHHRPAAAERRADQGVRRGPQRCKRRAALEGRTTLWRAVPEGRAVLFADGNRERCLAADRTCRPVPHRRRAPGRGQAGAGRLADFRRRQIPLITVRRHDQTRRPGPRPGPGPGHSVSR
ncbi:hypothetical protein D3C80_1356980 [compost metagenome]